MSSQTNNVSLRTASLIAGFAILGSVVVAPFAELYMYPKLIVPFAAAETAKNIIENRSSFIALLFAYFLAFLFDIIIAWGLYIFMKPVNESLSLLVAWLRLIYAVIALVALNNLVTAFQLLDTPAYLKIFGQDQLNSIVMLHVRAFKNHWYFGIIFFAIHLLLLGIIILNSTYVPRILGVILMITGTGYLLTTLRSYVFPTVNIDFARYTFYGELIFMLWLLLKGGRIPGSAALKQESKIEARSNDVYKLNL